jgi:hypothetical protein
MAAYNTFSKAQLTVQGYSKKIKAARTCCQAAFYNLSTGLLRPALIKPYQQSLKTG